ncbi:MAG: tRNA guanosine(15) transglycosylase TgtA [Desulfurococcaceae archaeon]
MFFEVKKYELAGRIGKLHTRHGSLETPYIFPVVDPARQVPSLDEIAKMGFKGIITNAYLFYMRNKGMAKRIHSELHWNNVIMTDSGGYQILVYGDVNVNNKTIVQYEKEIDIDIGVILDVPTGTKDNFDNALKNTYETYRRALEALPLIMDSDQLWVLPIQGAPYRELVIRSAILARRLPYHIYALGSPTVMLEKYKYSKLLELAIIAKIHLLPGKPLHVFGVGHPMIIPFLVAIGADLFDSASYILYARENRYMTETGTKHISELSYLPCNCPVCSRYDIRELNEVPDRERINMLSKHNLYILQREINNVKQAIRENRLWELMEYRSRAHPSLRKAFEIIIKYRGFLEKYSSCSNPSGKATMLIDMESSNNPRIAINVHRAMNIIAREIKGKEIILIPAYKKPYVYQEEYIRVKRSLSMFNNVKTLFIHPFLGLIPPQLISTYPFYQHVAYITRRSIEDCKILFEIIRKLSKYVKRIVVINTAWLSKGPCNDVINTIKSLLGEKFIVCNSTEISSHILQ